MKKRIWWIIAVSLILIGCMIFGGGMMAMNFGKLEISKYEVSQEFQNITIVSSTADITFEPSEREGAVVSCKEHKNLKHTVSVKDGTLVIELQDERAWYEHIGIILGTPKVTVYLPQKEYGELSVKVSTGDVDVSDAFTFTNVDIHGSTGDISFAANASGAVKLEASTGKVEVDDISAEALEVKVTTGAVKVSGAACTGDVTVSISTGKAKLSDVRCRNFHTTGTTGDVELEQVIAVEKLSAQRNTGDLELKDCDAGELLLKTTTGDVEAALLTEKIFITRTDTGDINVPKSTTGGICEITTDTGDINASIE